MIEMRLPAALLWSARRPSALAHVTRLALANTALAPPTLTLATTALATTLALAIAAPALAGEAVLYAPAPGWVEASELPADTSGPPVVLYDDQRRIEEGVLSSYVDRAIRIDNPQMLQAMGTLQAAWLPDKGDLTVNQVAIIRDGEEIDLLAQGSRFEVLRREAMLEQRTLDGARTATLTVPGLRVGDILRTRFTITLADQAMGREVQATAVLPTKPFEAGEARVMLSWPQDAGVTWKVTGAEDIATVDQAGGFERITVALPLAEREDPPQDAPVRYRMPPMLLAGTFASWTEVSATFAPHFATTNTIAAGSPVAEQIAKIAAGNQGQLARAIAALRLVQDEIAYQANGMDGGNYIPQSPAQTWETRFGDCKAKTLLLLAMLREMGIAAEATLVASQTGDMVPEMLPIPAAFDHVIVRATIDGTEYWLDGTNSGASLAVAIEVPAFHVALPIRDGGAELIPMLQRPQTAWDQDGKLTFDHRAGLDVPVLWHGEWVLTGAAAGQFRGMIGQTGEEQTENVIKQFVADKVPQSWVLDTDLAYDEASNSATVSVDGLVASPFEWERGHGQRGFDMLPTAGFEFRPDRSRRAWQGTPVALPGPYTERSAVTVLLPKAAAGGAYELDGREAYEETIAGVKLARSANLAGDELVITDSAAWPGGEMAYADIAGERARASRFGSTELLLRAPENAQRSFDVASRADRARFQPIEAAYGRLVEKQPDEAGIYRARAWFRLATLDREGSLADLDKLVELEPDAAAYSQRASLLLEMGRIEDAEADARQAYEINSSPEIAAVLAYVYGESGRPDEAIALLEEQNVNAEARTGLAVAISDYEARAGRKEEGLQRIEDQLVRRPGDAQLLNAKCWYQATWNFRPEDLASICTEAVERAGFSPPVLDSRAMGYFRLGRYEDALKDLNTALADSPDRQPSSLYLRGVVRLELGDNGGRSDIDEALTRHPSLQRQFDRWGISHK